MSTQSVDIAALSQRPKRADAARNYDKLIAAGREAFAEQGPEASLEEIARRAEVGIATLYRNFPTRQALLEAVYLEEILNICKAADGLEDLEPWDALVAWLHRYTAFAGTKRALFQELSGYLDADSAMFTHCRTAIWSSAEPLLLAAQANGDVRADVSFIDVVKMVGSIATMPGAEPEQVARILDVAIDGLRTRA